MQTATVNKRVSELINISGLSVYAYARKCDIPPTTLAPIVKGKKDKKGERYFHKPTFDVIAKLLENGAPYGQKVNPDWLILGKGKPIIDQQDSEGKHSMQLSEDGVQEKVDMRKMIKYLEEYIEVLKEKVAILTEEKAKRKDEKDSTTQKLCVK